jgi:hypothetical protein
VTKTAMPTAVGVTLARGDADPYFAETKSFAYSVTQPNGASCEPTCRQGLAEFRVP